LQNPHDGVLKLLRLPSIEVLVRILMTFLKMNQSTLLPKFAETESWETTDDANKIYGLLKVYYLTLPETKPVTKQAASA
jgi:hypothetical protein